MNLVPLTPETFSFAVIELALASGDDYRECVLELCERHGIDLADAPSLLTAQLKELIEYEAKRYHLLKK